MPPPSNGAHVVQGELNALVTCMRRNARWAGAQEEQDPLLLHFSQLKEKLATVTDVRALEVETLIGPFLEVVRSEVTTGPITGTALSSLNKFLSYGLIDAASSPRAASAIENIADAVTHAKFVGTDLASDEVVLMKILQVLRTLLLSPAGACMSNESVCELMQSCFRICFEIRLSELLRRSAEQSLTDMIHHIFSRLDDMAERFPQQSQVLSPPMKATLKRTTDSSDEEVIIQDSVPQIDEPGVMVESSEAAAASATAPAGDAAKADEGAEAAGDATAAADTNGVPNAQQLRTNSRGVKFTQQKSEDNSAGPLLPYSVPCVRELFRFLCSLINPRDRHNTETMIGMGLSLITVAFETSGHKFHEFPSLMELVADEMCRSLFYLLQSHNLTLFSAALRVVFLSFESQRSRLKLQMIRFLTIVMEMRFATYEHKEGALDTILQLARIPGFMIDLYLNCDCDLYSPDVYDPLVKFLSQTAFPDEQGLLTTNLVSLDALLAVVAEINARSDSPVHKVNEKTARSRLPSVDELVTTKHKKKMLKNGMEIFNEDAKKGIKYFEEHSLLSTPARPAEIATLFRSDSRLDKAKIGEYIGNPKHVATLEAFVSSFDFSDKHIDEALRQFLESFRIPGESQIISRILERFADAWMQTYKGELVVANRDVAYVLSYAIIMLNVDQHNPKNKTRMKLKDFFRQQGKLNDNKDFPPEFLEGIYNSIKNKEIVMPEEQDGEVREDYQWKVLLAQSRMATMPSITAQVMHIYDQDVFLTIWGPIVQSLCVVFDTATDERITAKAIRGFETCAQICTRFELSEVFDNIVVALCNRTQLSSPVLRADVAVGASLEAVVLRHFMGSPLPPVAARLVFALVKRHGNILREGWQNVLDLIVTMHVAKLLPEAMCRAPDYLAPDGQTLLAPTKKRRVPKADSSLFSNIASFLVGGGESAGVDVPEQATGRDTEAREAIASYGLLDLFKESKFLKVESLLELLKGVMRFTTTELALTDQTAGLPFSADISIFFLELLGNVALWNKDRISLFWPDLAQHLEARLQTVKKPSRVFERLGLTILRLAFNLLRQDDFQIRGLELVQPLLAQPPEALAPCVVHFSAAMASLIKDNSAHVYRTDGWDTVLDLLACFQTSQPTLAHVTDLLTIIVVEGKVITPTRFPKVLSVVVGFAEASKRTEAAAPPGKQRLQPPQPPAASPEPAAPALHQDSDAARIMLSLLHALHGQVTVIFQNEEQVLWQECWEPLLHGICSLCTDLRRDVRQAAVTVLQRSLLLPDLEEHLNPVQWQACVQGVLFPLLMQLLELPLAGGCRPTDLEETRMRACTLLCKVFLQHLAALLSLPDFSGLWLQTLNLMDKYMHADDSELMREAVPESLKNMLLVMSTAGIFKPPQTGSAPDDPANELWNMTWLRVNSFLPLLHNELFPDTPGGVSLDASTAIAAPSPTPTAAGADRNVTPPPSLGAELGTPPRVLGSSASLPASPRVALYDEHSYSVPASPGRAGRPQADAAHAAVNGSAVVGAAPSSEPAPAPAADGSDPNGSLSTSSKLHPHPIIV